jgi:hypothetical protein
VRGLIAVGVATLNDKALGVTDGGKILLMTVHDAYPGSRHSRDSRRWQSGIRDAFGQEGTEQVPGGSGQS